MFGRGSKPIEYNVPMDHPSVQHVESKPKIDVEESLRDLAEKFMGVEQDGRIYDVHDINITTYYSPDKKEGRGYMTISLKERIDE